MPGSLNCRLRCASRGRWLTVFAPGVRVDGSQPHTLLCLPASLDTELGAWRGMERIPCVSVSLDDPWHKLALFVAVLRAPLTSACLGRGTRGTNGGQAICQTCLVEFRDWGEGLARGEAAVMKTQTSGASARCQAMCGSIGSTAPLHTRPCLGRERLRSRSMCQSHASAAAGMRPPFLA